MDTLDDFLMTRPATAASPLLGVTVLLVEDSRYAAEAFRLLCQRSGARIRRADSIAAAKRHLRVYQPTVIIIDIGLPDAPGTTLIEELAHSTPRVDIILGTSGDPGTEALALAAGADGFLSKPMQGLAAFQHALLRHLPADRHPKTPRVVQNDKVMPDPIALRDDLEHIVDILSNDSNDKNIEYIAQFTGGIGRSLGDDTLCKAANNLADTQAQNGAIAPKIANIARIVRSHLNDSAQI